MPLSPIYQEFSTDLAKLADDDHGAERAILRRGLGKSLGESFDAYRVLPGWLASGNQGFEDNCFLVATLFALHPLSLEADPEGRQSTNLGASFRRLMDQVGRESVEARFVALLNSHADDLPLHLRHIVSLLRSAKVPVPVDWGQLLHDLEYWSHDSRSVQRAWARAYWRTAPTPGNNAPAPGGGHQSESDNPTDDRAAE